MIDRATTDKMLELVKELASPSKSQPDLPHADTSAPAGKVHPSTDSALSSDMVLIIDPPPPVMAPSDVPSPSSLVSVPPPARRRRATVLRTTSSEPDVPEEDRERICSELLETGPSRSQFLAASEKLEGPSKKWWNDHAPCMKCTGADGDCIPHPPKNPLKPITSCELCHEKRVLCSMKSTWHVLELARLHPDWPLWWIQEKADAGWLKKLRGGKYEASQGMVSTSKALLSKGGKGKRKLVASSDSEQHAKGESDSEAVVEIAPPPRKARRRVGTSQEPLFHANPKPPVRRPLAKVPTSQPSQKAVPKTTIPVPSSSKIPDPLFVPSPVVARSFVPDPASPLTIQVHPKPPPFRISSPRLAASHPAPTSAPHAGASHQPPAQVTPGFEDRTQAHGTTVFSRGDVLRARVADGRRQAMVYVQQLSQVLALSSMRASQLEAIRRELRERDFELSPSNSYFLDEVIEGSHQTVLQYTSAMNPGRSEYVRQSAAGGAIQDDQDLINEMDEEGFDPKWG
ncbi:hypothetical protein H0H93_004285 [Arthromyces matolae]|nr:hypothetical protein H0H93_004285 [Arthromyces matolae]